MTRPKSVLNSQYHSRLDTPSPITTGMNTTVRVTRRSGEFADGQQRQQVAADDEDRRDERGVLQREAERHPELAVVERPLVVGQPDAPRRRDQRPVVQRHPDHLAQRVDGEGEDEEQCRAQVGEPDQPASRASAHGDPPSAGVRRAVAPVERRARRRRCDPRTGGDVLHRLLGVGDDRVEVVVGVVGPLQHLAATGPAAS